MRYARLLLITLGLLSGTLWIEVVAGVGDPDPAPWPPPPATLQLEAVDVLKQNTTEERLGNGTVVDPKDWPASFYATFFTTNGEAASCTATLVGARSLLTAAHCIADGGHVSFRRGNQTYTGDCEQAKPGYQSPESQDWAMCLMSPEVPARYETIDLDIGVLRRNDQLLLAGFGCQKIGSNMTDGKFRTGPAFIEKELGQVAGDPDWIATYAAIARGDAFICPGDSGGAVFFEEPNFPRTVVGVNSHYDTAGTGVSFLAVLGTLAGIDFLKKWAQRHDQRLCGVHGDAPNCLR
jgi:hypothetical protein